MRSSEPTDFFGKEGLSRRSLLATSVAGLVSVGMPDIGHGRTPYKAVAFDAFPIFDPRPIFAKVAELYPENGAEISQVWRTKQFEYSWLRTAGHQYKDFWGVTQDALDYAFASKGIVPEASHREQLMNMYLSLKPWPEVEGVLRELKKMEIRVGFLSNMTEQMLRSSMDQAGIEEYFELVVSTDQGRTYKPSPSAYELGVKQFGFKKSEILFVAFAGWDASGASWFGYPTYWVNRLGTVQENLDVAPTGVGKNLNDMLKFITSSSG